MLSQYFSKIINYYMLKKLKPTIAILDSGIGGISILQTLIKKYHSGNFIYFADNLYMPYGNKRKTFLKRRVENIIVELFDKYKVDFVIVACNTASSLIDETKYQNVLTMRFNPNINCFATKLTKKMLHRDNIIADSTLATRIEKNIFNRDKLDSIIKQHIKKYRLNELDCFVLGCTHYELVIDIFKKYCPNSQIIKNSSYILKYINYFPNTTDLTIEFLQSKNSESYLNKLNKLIRR